MTTPEDKFDLGEADEELGSPLLTVESGWLLGLLIGLCALLGLAVGIILRQASTRINQVFLPLQSPGLLPGRSLP